jgi:ribonuclease P/MRP protein subunit RPP40
MEHTIKDHLLGYLLNKNLISKHQHAFIIKHSTASNLLECIHDWSVALNDSNSVDVIYIDFKRAFESIVYSKLIHKLTCYGISGKLLAWISAFLHNQLLSVVMENTNSTYVDVISGVPQGSGLGPILFTNDIVTACLPNTELKLFADDLKLYSVVKVTNPLTGLDSLQQSLDRIYLWAIVWQFVINVSKTNALTLSNKLRSKATRHYSVNQICLSCKELTPDLGILTDSCLSFRDHNNNIVSKSLQRCGVLFREFVSRDLSFLIKAFVVYVRPILEYNSCIWNPSQ